MQNLKTPKGTVKKGISLVGCGIIPGTTTAPTDKSYVSGLSIEKGVAIPYLYESVFNTQNPNVTILSPTQFQLKKGFTYKLKFNNVTRYASNSGNLQHRFFDVTNSTWIGGIGYSSSDYYSLAGDFWDRNSHATAIITTLVDTIIEVRNTCSVNLTEVWGGTFTEVEELESYLIPTDPTKYTDVTNFTSATGTVTIPSGLPIGTKRLIRKVNSTQGTVTINCTGETFTSSSLSSVTLNSDGDFWLLEKITSTRWYLIDGRESGSNSYGKWKKFADGRQRNSRNLGTVLTFADGSFSLNNPLAFYAGKPVKNHTVQKTHTDNATPSNNVVIGQADSITPFFYHAYRLTDGVRINSTTIPFTAINDEELVCEGYWY